MTRRQSLILEFSTGLWVLWNQGVPLPEPRCVLILSSSFPVKDVDAEYEPKHNRAATLAELMQFVRVVCLP